MAAWPAAARSCTNLLYTAMSVEAALRSVLEKNSSRKRSPASRPGGLSVQATGTSRDGGLTTKTGERP